MQVGRKVAFVVAANVAGAVLGYGTLLVIGRAFDPAAYGLFVFASSLGGLYALAATLGLGSAHQRLVARGEPEDRVLGTASRLRLLLMAGLGAVVAAILGAAALLGRPLLTDATTPAVLAGALAIQVVAMGRQLLAETWGGRQSVARIELARLVDAVLLVTLLANAGLLLRHLAGQWAPVPGVGAWWADVLGWSGPATPERTAMLLVACTLAAKLVSTLLAAIWAMRDGIRVGPYDKAIARQLWAFGLPMAMAGAIGLIVGYTDVVLLGFFWTAREVGLYGTAQKLVVLAGLAAAAASGVLFSRFAQLNATGDHAAEAHVQAQAERWLLVVTVPIVAAFAALARPALHIAVGDRYLPGAPALAWLSLATLAFVMQVPLTARFMGHGLTRTPLAAGAANAASNVAFNLVFVPPAALAWGPAGAAVATLLSNGIAYLVLAAQARRRFGRPLMPAAWLRTALAAAPVGLAWWQAAARWPAAVDRVWELGALGAAGLAAYVLLLAAFGVVGRADLALARRILHPRALADEMLGR